MRRFLFFEIFFTIACLLLIMCGRYSLHISADDLESFFEAEFEGSPYPPNYNVTPQTKMPVITNEDPRLFQFITWGLHPVWLKVKTGIINIRSEAVQTKPFFKKLFEAKRCLIPATGFYEWKKESGKKIPYYFTLKDTPVFSFGGIWFERKITNNETERFFAILTTEANDILSPIHNRMPVILSHRDEKEWLNDDTPITTLAHLMSPFDAKRMQFTQVSTKVNNPKNNSAELINSV